MSIDETTERSGPDGAPPDAVDPLRWQVLNLSVMPLWLAMVLAPESRITRRLMDRSGWWFAGLSAAYVAQLVQAAAASDGPPRLDPEGVREMLAAPSGFLAGWTHYLAFDLFVGRWIWERGLAEGRSTRLALVLTLMAGPAGLGVFALQRRALTP
jgi:hypothetical protein